MIVLKVETIKRHIISVVFMRNSIIASLYKCIILNLLRLLGIRLIMNSIVPLFLKLIFLNIGNFIGIVLILNILLLLNEFLLSQVGLTTLMVFLGEFHRIISVRNIIDIILMFISQLHIGIITSNQIVLNECVEFLLIREVVNSFKSGAPSSWCLISHV